METETDDWNIELEDEEMVENEETIVDRHIITEQDKLHFIQEQRNKNTITKTKSTINIFSDFLRTQNENIKIEDMDRDKLNSVLESFFMTLTKANGDEYEPNSINSIFSGINRYLQEKRYGANLSSSPEFQGARDILKAKMKVNV